MNGRTRTAIVLMAMLVLGGCTSAPPALAPSPSTTLSGAPDPSSPTAEPTAFVAGLTIPWAIGGTRLRSDGRTVFEPGEWPAFPVQAVRLWDTRTTWLHLEPARGRIDVSALGAHLARAQAAGVDDVLLVLGGTPRWAAVRVTADDAPWLGPGSASPPRFLSQWTRYVRAVAEGHRGQLSYEIGNEPNLRTFWNGTSEEYAALVLSAARTIHDVDPDALVVAGGPLIRRTEDLPAITTWLGPIAEDPDVDVVSVHTYPSVRRPGEARDLLRSVRDAVAEVTDKPVWVTEMNVRGGDLLPAAEQRTLVRDLPQAVEAAGFDRGYWYAWTQFLTDGLLPLAPGTPGGRQLATDARAG